MSKNIVLTGATGFVGRQILRALQAAGHRVTIACRSEAEQVTSNVIEYPRVIETPDMFAEDEIWWAERLKGFDTLIHAAWYVEPGRYQDSPENIRCALGTREMVLGAIDAGITHFIGLGTCMEYRLPSATLSVDAPLGPSTLYSASKLATYFMLQRHFNETAINFTWARLFYLFGEGEHPDRLIPYIRRQIENEEPVRLSAGTQIRDYLDVADAGRMIATLVDNGQTGPVNICSGLPVTVREVAQGIAAQYGRTDLLEFGQATLHPSDPAAVVGISNLRGLKRE